MLQNLEKSKRTIMEKLPIGKRVALKILLPLAHSCVSNREATKSILIRFLSVGNFTFYRYIFCCRTVDQFRKAYTYLGETMVQSGFLSEPGLIWFLTHHEIGQSLQATGYYIAGNKAFIGSIFIAQRPQKQTTEKSNETETPVSILG